MADEKSKQQPQFAATYQQAFAARPASSASPMTTVKSATAVPSAVPVSAKTSLVTAAKSASTIARVAPRIVRAPPMSFAAPISAQAGRSATRNWSRYAAVGSVSAKGMPEPLTARKSSKPCCDDCGKAEALGKRKSCGSSSRVVQTLRTKLASFARPDYAALGGQPGRLPDLRGQFRPSGRGQARPLSASCFVPFTLEQRACLTQAWVDGMEATISPSPGSLWEEVIANNHRLDIWGAYGTYTRTWTRVFGDGWARCYPLFPSDVVAGPDSVGVQVQAAMDLPVALFDSVGPANIFLHGGGHFPAGYYDPLCEARSPGCNGTETPLSAEQQAIADRYLRKCVMYANLKAPLAPVLFAPEAQIAARNNFWLTAFWDCMFGSCEELQNDSGAADLTLITTLGFDGIQAYADSTFQTFTPSDPIPTYGMNGPGAFDTSVLTQCGTNHTLC